MRARYIGDPKRAGEGPEVTTTFGLTFLKGAWVNITDPVAIRKLSNNTHFEVDKGSAPSGQPGQSGKQAVEPAGPVTVPDNWREVHHSTRLKLARSLGATVANVQEADAFLAEYTAPKAAAPAVPPVASDDDWGDLDPEA